MSDKTLLLVDGMAVVYRSFFAIRELSTSDGRATNAVFGFVRALKQLQETWSPTHLVVAFDGGKPVERVELLEDYKAQRPSMPDPLREQLPLVNDYLERSGVVMMLQDKQEADDVIASLAVWAPDDAKVLIASSDKDLFQLIDERVQMVNTTGKPDVMDADGVRTKTGVRPDQIIDWLALVGDSADNIPGVPGVGPKTAAKLLVQFGSVARMWERLNEVTNDKLRGKLHLHHDAVTRNRELVRLRQDLPLDTTWDELAVADPDAGRLLSFFEDLELETLAKPLREPTLF